MKKGYTYILANQKNGTLYIGVTSDLEKRIYQHKTGYFGGFTQKYKLHRLIFFETYDDIEQAILREKKLKGWNRAWKIALIEKHNPDWIDLSIEWIPGHAGNDK